MGTPRLRYHDGRKTHSITVLQDQYSKISCSDANPAWRNIGSGVGTYKVGTYKSMQDEVIPGFQIRRKKGEVFFNPLHACSQTFSNGYGQSFGEQRATTPVCTGSQAYYNAYRYYGTGDGSLGRIDFVCPQVFTWAIDASGACYPPPQIITDTEISAMVSEVSTSARADRGKSPTPQWETIAEARKSIGMVSQALKEMNSFFSKNKSLLTRCKKAGNLYLLYRYGFTPVYLAAAGAIDALKIDLANTRWTSRSNLSVTKNSSFTTSRSPWGAWSANYLTSISEVTRVKASILDSYEMSMSQAMGFDPYSLVTLPWELTPYSFVADWFVNIGDFLSASIPRLDMKELGGSVTITRDYIAETRLSTYVGSAGYSIVTPPGDVGFSYIGTQKIRRPSVEPARLVVLNNFRLDELLRAADLSALLIQKVRRA